MGRKGTRVLLKKPSGKDVIPTDQFAWNKSFTSDRVKFKINQIQQDMSEEESTKTNEQVAIDRVSVLEATIVRIMKGRKKMTMQLLVDAVVVDVSKRFPPDVKEIKRRMESLIEREVGGELGSVRAFADGSFLCGTRTTGTCCTISPRLCWVARAAMLSCMVVSHSTVATTAPRPRRTAYLRRLDLC